MQVCLDVNIYVSVFWGVCVCVCVHKPMCAHLTVCMHWCMSMCGGHMGRVCAVYTHPYTLAALHSHLLPGSPGASSLVPSKSHRAASPGG